MPKNAPPHNYNSVTHPCLQKLICGGKLHTFYAGAHLIDGPKSFTLFMLQNKQQTSTSHLPKVRLINLYFSRMKFICKDSSVLIIFLTCIVRSNSAMVVFFVTEHTIAFFIFLHSTKSNTSSLNKWPRPNVISVECHEKGSRAVLLRYNSLYMM